MFIYSRSMALGKNLKHLRKLIGNPPRIDIAHALNEEDDTWLYQLENRNSKHSKHSRGLAAYFQVDHDVLTTQDITGLSLEEIRAMTSKSDGRMENEKLLLLSLYELLSPEERRDLVLHVAKLVKAKPAPPGAIESALDSIQQPEQGLPEIDQQEKAPRKSRKKK